MTSKTTERFRKAHAQLPEHIRRRAREAYRLFRDNPTHPSLRFKQVHATRLLACPRCAGRLRLVATVEDPHAIRAILESLGLPAEGPQPDPLHPPPAEAGGLPATVLS